MTTIGNSLAIKDNGDYRADYVERENNIIYLSRCSSNGDYRADYLERENIIDLTEVLNCLSDTFKKMNLKS